MLQMFISYVQMGSKLEATRQGYKLQCKDLTSLPEQERSLKRH